MLASAAITSLFVAVGPSGDASAFVPGFLSLNVPPVGVANVISWLVLLIVLIGLRPLSSNTRPGGGMTWMSTLEPATGGRTRTTWYEGSTPAASVRRAPV